MARRSVWLLGLVVFLPGCIPSLDPLSDVTKAEPDRRLLGDWAKPGEKVQLRIAVPEVKGNPTGLMRATNPTKPNSANETLWFFVTKLNQESYVNVLLDKDRKGDAFVDLGPEGEFAKWQRAPGRRYLILHYAVADEELTLNLGDEKAFKDLLKREKIEVDKEEVPMAAEGWLAKYLTKNGPGELYPKGKGQRVVRQK
jgi:hypothetical protein